MLPADPGLRATAVALLILASAALSTRAAAADKETCDVQADFGRVVVSSAGPSGSIYISQVKHALTCILAIAGWYLLYPPATHNGNPDSYNTALSQWNIDSSFSTAADCREAHHGDLNGLQGLDQASRDFLQTQAGQCVPSDDPRLAD